MSANTPQKPAQTATEPDPHNPAPSAYANYQPSQQALNALQRGTRYSRELACEILGDIAAGASLALACERHDLHPVTFYRWINAQVQNVSEDEAAWLRSEYAHARELRGEYYGDRVAEVADQALTGDVDPRAARAALDGYQWTAARMSPGSWGDRHQVDVRGQVQHAHAHIHASADEESRLMGLLRGGRDAVEGEQTKQVESRPAGESDQGTGEDG